MIVRKMSNRWVVYNDKNAVVASCKTRKEAEELAWNAERKDWKEVDSG